MSQLHHIGEDPLIERLLRQTPVAPSPAGPGDDCAVVDRGGDTLQLLKTDAIVSGIHFLADTPAAQVGWKAAARVISDFAAMGGRPEHFLITIAVPGTTEVRWMEELYQGIGRCLGEHGGKIVGGETSRSPDASAAVISVAATGCVARSQLTLRSTAKAGDTLLVTGALGGSIDGKHLEFQPRLEQADWLTSHFKPTAMMDLSDGLAKDLPRLAAASGCGFRLERDALPLTPGHSIDQALGDGEDYELLFSIEAARSGELLSEWRSHFPDLPLTPIGSLCAAGSGDALKGGWDHFA